MQLLPSGLPTGIGTDQERTAATAFIRQQPWYQNMLAAWGIPPTTGDVKLNDEQQAAVLTAARNKGIAIPEGQHINENGQIAKDDSHLWRNIGIGAAIGGLALTGLGAAGIGPMAGLFGSTAAAGEGAAAGLGAAETATPFGVGALDASSLGIASGIAPEVAGAGSALAGMVPDEVINVTGNGEFDPAMLYGQGTDASMATGADAVNGFGGGVNALGTGQRVANLVKGIQNLGGGPNGTTGGGLGTTPRGNAAAGAAAQLAANRAAQAKIDQGGPAADKTAMQNLFRSAIVARMNPNASPVVMNGMQLPSLVNSDLVSQAGAYNKSLAGRLAAGKTATDFGIADPTAQETALNNKALDATGLNGGVNGTMADISDYLNTGSRMASLGSNAYNLGKTLYNVWS